jgi:LysM repeat protein
MGSRLKIINKKRFFFAFSTLLLLLILIFVITVYAFDSSPSIAPRYREYVVSQGDTLWDISIENKGDMDVRTYLYTLKKINDLGSSDIRIGMKLKLP